MTNSSSGSPLGADSTSNERQTVKYFFQEKYAPLNVKGNFLTLCACPKNVELGEWLAHQNGKAARISAPKFINRVEKWIVSKIHDPVMFPTEQVSAAPITFALAESANAPGGLSGPPPANPPISNNGTSPTGAAGQDWIGKSSGFPPTFYKDCQGIMKQMFRCYAHLYHAHWENPFWHINKHEVLNMCFVHFVTVAKYYKLVADKEMEPMEPLINIYITQEKIPPEALAGHWAQQPAPSSTTSQG
ncbi:conserved hypothetical protein [Uncinocarpus reesii 1704]|uniref:Uncharacterized protein n=1 Tax=Uncinocarpus reesii (strain UAMH 1704) TaxID=336963 RepID=C4JTG3_UNCRE|nr:uncharacterized protein UREG_05752 [Uncinocarpus reesii 1704]EEP80910.1 conserved hypothetical protein [Uncinocarpus reesii 1704]